MAKLPDFTALGERPVPVSRGNVTPFRPTSGLEGEAERGLAVAGNEFEKTANVLLKAKEEADTLAAEDAFNKLKQKQLDLTYGKDGFLNLKGADAVNRDVPAQYGTQLVRASQELSQGLSNDYQRQLFAKRASTTQLQLQEQAFHHVAQQSDVYANQVLNGTMEVESRLVAAGAPPDVSLVRINAAIDRHAQRFGSSEQEVTAMKMKAADSIWTSKVRELIYTDPLAAQAVFKAHEAEIGPANKPVLEHALKTAVLPVEAKRLADGLINEFGKQRTAIDARASLSSLLSNAEKLADQKHPDDLVFRDLVTQQIKGYVNTIVVTQDGIARQAHAALMTAAMGVEGGPKPLTVEQLLASRGAREAWTLTDPQQQRGILALLDHNARAAQGIPMKADAKVEEALFQRIHLPDNDPNKIRLPGQLTPFFGKGLNQSAYDWLKKEIDDLQTPDGQRLAEVRKQTIESFKGQFDKSTMVFVDPKGPEQFNKFRQFVMEKERKLRTEGKDPYQIYNRNSKDYIGNDVPAFQRSLAQQMRDMAQAVQGGTPDPTPTPGLPPEAAAKLREGVNTAFGNGQVWTLRNGQPMQVR